MGLVAKIKELVTSLSLPERQFISLTVVVLRFIRYALFASEASTATRAKKTLCIKFIL